MYTPPYTQYPPLVVVIWRSHKYFHGVMMSLRNFNEFAGHALDVDWAVNVAVDTDFSRGACCIRAHAGEPNGTPLLTQWAVTWQRAPGSLQASAQGQLELQVECDRDSDSSSQSHPVRIAGSQRAAGATGPGPDRAGCGRGTRIDGGHAAHGHAELCLGPSHRRLLPASPARMHVSQCQGRSH